ncbi:MAG: dTDP-4-dehydrorhamnose 3,5-epimerase [Spirochaetales bacterium]|nr:dTDP-4-dehydrorhamnose 3,5-epimerase [Spirochaetales bacterium]
MPFRFTPGPLDGIVVVNALCFADRRGSFTETYRRSAFHDAGIMDEFSQDNVSVSARGVVRGLHFQTGAGAQHKLVSVVRGTAWDVAVDLRPQSPTRLRWFGMRMDGMDGAMLYIPAGFAHGFMALSQEVILSYKCGPEYDAALDSGYRWDDPDIGIVWPDPGVPVVLSERDAALPLVRDLF